MLDQFRKIALDPKVSGSDEFGSLAARRNRRLETSPLDLRIAAAMTQYLQSNFTYTLDLTDARTLSDGRDPLLMFLTDWKKGHCEFFAGAMAVLCQSLGMDARVVVGFKCDEYNTTPGANYYIVRQSQAHAWVEVRAADGWHTFDPTSNREAEIVQKSGVWEKFKHVLDYLEYTWANSVVAYDRDNQGNLMRNAEQVLTDAGSRGTSAASTSKDWLHDALKSWFTESNFFIVSSKLLSVLIYLAFFAAIGAVGRFFWEKWMLRRRARRIGLENLPASAQLRLARQLGFYDDLMQLLERYGVVRPRHLTPLEFSESIAFLPNQAYTSVQQAD